MHHLAYYLGISKHVEVVLLTLFGIYLTVSDKSLLELPTKLNSGWNVPLDPEHFSQGRQLAIKKIISLILVTKAFSVYLYMASYIIMLWPAIFEERPVLLLPWLITGAIVGFGIELIELITGIYLGISYGGYRIAFYEFLLSYLVKTVLFFYMWMCILSYYRDLKIKEENALKPKKKLDVDLDVISRRRKARTLTDGLLKQAVELDDDDRNLISVSTIENRVQQLTTDLHRKDTRSWDSLVSVKTALSDQDSMSTCDEFFDNETDLSIVEKASRILNISKDDVEIAKKERIPPSKLFTENVNLSNMEKKLQLKDTYSFRQAGSQKMDVPFETKSLQKVIGIDNSEIQLNSTINYSNLSIPNQTKPPGIIHINQDEEFMGAINFETLTKHIQSTTETKSKIALKKPPSPASLRKKPIKRLRTKLCDYSCQACSSKTILNPTRDTLSFLNTNISCTKKITSKTDKGTISQSMMTEKEPKVEFQTRETEMDDDVREELPKPKQTIPFGIKSVYRTDGFSAAYLNKSQRENV